MNDDDIQEQQRKRAYFIWISAGRPDGYALEHWMQAERELARERQHPRWIRYEVQRRDAD